MLAELNEVKKHLVEKFGDVDSVPPGTYAIPTETSKGKAFMRVTIAEDMGMSDFSLWMDDSFTKDWLELTMSVKIYHLPGVIEKVIAQAGERLWGYIEADDYVTIYFPEEEVAGLFYIGLIVA